MNKPDNHTPKHQTAGVDFRQTIASLEIAVLLPCHNEEVAIGQVIRDFRKALPSAAIYVFDNNSTDKTREIALGEGAIVREEKLQGKGNVVRRMFSDIDADYYILADGDDTYDAGASIELLRCAFDNHLDMVNGSRKSEQTEAYRPGHRFGNKMLTRIVGMIFGNRIEDMLSGFRVFSRRFVKSFPALSTGFEIETELTIHALELNMPIAEVATIYRGRPEGSESKLHTFRDGVRILLLIMRLVKEERPLQLFSSLFAILASTSIVLAWPIVTEFMATGLVPRFPTAILSTGMMLLAFLSIASGLILDTVTHGRREMKRMWYLSIPERSAISDSRSSMPE
jgi:glycosyltransferase involved in cell wall biosynthesis